MTLTEALTRARLYSQLSTVYISTSELTTRMNQAELDTALDFMEMQPGAAAYHEFVEYPANTYGQICDRTWLTTIPVNRGVHKILGVSYAPSGQDRWYKMDAVDVREMAGSGGARDLGRDTATLNRWYFDGTSLFIYPMPGDDMRLRVSWVLTPVPQNDGDKPILEDFAVPVRVYSELVPLRCARLVMHDRGMDTTWIDKEVERYEARVNAQLPLLQMQEPAVILGTRYDD